MTSVRSLLAILALTIALSPAHAEDARVRQAATKSIALLQKVSRDWYKTQTCISCHHQVLPMMALDIARQHGVAVNEEIARQTVLKTFATYKNFDNAVQYVDQIDPAVSDGNALLAAHASGMPASLTTSIYARQISTRQRPDGSWFTIDNRPPQSHSRFTATAVGLRALQLYMPKQLQANAQAGIEKARRWLLTNEPLNTEDRTFRLFGLKWSGAEAVAIQKAGEELLKSQRADGGWAQIPGRDSDAYATGEVLVALQQAAGIPVDDPRWQRGIKFLLDQQRPDGSWQVASRIMPPAQVSPPYFESGFPYGHDQFISAAATSWAASALMLTLKPQPVKPADSKTWTALAPAGLQIPAKTLEAVLFGSAADLRRLLDAGLDAQSKTPDGTTLLMMAAHDLDKVRLLVDRGANVNARSRNGFNALMSATNHGGSAPVARYLLDHGAEVTAPAGVKVRYGTSPLIVAAFTGEHETVDLLLDHGADVNGRMELLGLAPITALELATTQGDQEMVRHLVRRGADINLKDQNGYTPVFWAVLGGFPDLTREMISLGAKINEPDNFGMTLLLYASGYYHGETDTVKVLLKAGAKRDVRSKDGDTPLTVAKKYRLDDVTKLLTESR